MPNKGGFRFRATSGLLVKNVNRSKAKNLMKMIFLHTMVLGWGILSHPVGAQPGPATFPLAGDWQGVLWSQGSFNHLILHMNMTPEGKVTCSWTIATRASQANPQSAARSTAATWPFNFFIGLRKATAIL
jgi:hypothetical protein